MKGINTSPLIERLNEYSFFDWDWELEDDYYKLILGMPQEIFSVYQISHFYDSWGYDAVENESASPSFFIEQWRLLENDFFRWLKQAEHVLFPKEKVIVSPLLGIDWLDYGIYDENLTEKYDLMKEEIDQFQQLLTKEKIYINDLSRLDYRGAFIESFEEIIILGKLSVRDCSNVHFFVNQEFVLHLTEYLTVIIHCKNKEIYLEMKKKLKKILNPVFLNQPIRGD